MCAGSQPSTRGSVDRPFLLSAAACVLDPDTDASRPGKRCNSCRATPTRKTPTDMDIVTPTSDIRPDRPTRPSVCPICAMYADNGVITRAEVTSTATYLDTAGHMWSVTWLEVA